MRETPWDGRWTDQLLARWREATRGEDDPQTTVGRDTVRARVRTEPVADVGAPTPGTVVLRPEPKAALAAQKSRELARGLTLVGELGAGGMGVVYRAVQDNLQREVAVKCLKPRDDFPDADASFQSEACVAARLDHPNIVPVHDMGVTPNGQPYYTMKVIDGRAWDEVIIEQIERGMTAEDIRGNLEILLEVANAIAFAHSRGIIHRDIKPQNVMIGEYGETLVGDWGLAVAIRPLGPQSKVLDLSQVVITCGTPAFMPPEIASDQRDWVGPWSDVYELGATLYCILYGTPPRREHTTLAALEIATRNEWRFPQDIAPVALPFHDVLGPVVIRALATHPQQRYADGRAFADALRDGLTRLDSAQLAVEAASLLERARVGPAAGSHNAIHAGGKEGYAALARAILLFEQALQSWPEYASARRNLVDAHLLYVKMALDGREHQLARSHLDAAAYLPHGIVPTADQIVQRKRLSRQLHAQIAGEERRRRRAKVMQWSAMSLGVTLLLAMTLATLAVRHTAQTAENERNHLSRMMIDSVASRVSGDMGTLLTPVRTTVRVVARWGETGRLNRLEGDVLIPLFLPLLVHQPALSGIITADDLGNEFTLLRTPQGFRTRTLRAGAAPELAKLGAEGEVLESWQESIDYHPHNRPWYRGAIAMTSSLTTTVETRPLYWSDPYLFFTTKDPGVTASMLAKRPNGRQIVVGVDLSFADVSELTASLLTENEGKVFVTSRDGRMLGLPHSPNLPREDWRAAMLTPGTDLNDPIAVAALQQWLSFSSPETGAFRMRAVGQPWWAGFRKIPLADAQWLWVAVVLPESNFAESS